jgi:hypothetical protein
MSGLSLALLSLGFRFYALASETDFVASQVSESLFPNIVQADAVEDLRGEDLRLFLQRRHVRGIILGGGSPCQGNSALNLKRRGLDDPRSQQPQHLKRLHDEIAALPEARGLELVLFLENVASMPSSVQQQYSEWLGCPPILIDAAACGWVQRRRLFWLASRSRGVSPACDPPRDWEWVQHEAGPPELRFGGAKPVPAQVHFSEGFKQMFDPVEVLRHRGAGAFHPFTREFYHPADRVHLTSPDAAERFFQDGRRFPPSAYVRESLVWRGDSWRQPAPHERCQIMGIPARCLDSISGPSTIKRQRQNSLIGNGFHIPMIMALFAMLPQLLEAKLTHPVLDFSESQLRHRLQGTVWEPGRLTTYPGLLQPSDIVSDMQEIFRDCPVDPPVWRQVRGDLDLIDLASLQAFTAWSLGSGFGDGDFGPTPFTSSHRANIFAGLSGQRYPGSSTKGLDHLIEPGVGKEEHIRRARGLPSPFRTRFWPERDVDFVLYAVQTWGPFLPAYANRLRRLLVLSARAVEPLEIALARFRSLSARRVASQKRPGFVAFLTAILRWPDRAQPLSLLRGYPIVGDQAASGVFRFVTPKTAADPADWLGPAAIEAIDRLERSGPPLHMREIFQATCEEQAKGFCSAFQSRTELDTQYGPGKWRPLERFIIDQGSKLRVIDNARKTGHNAITTLHETIHTVSIDFVPSVLKQLADRMGVCDPAEWGARAPWLHFRLGTDDLPDAYRGLPVQESHLPFSAVAVFVPDVGWRYTTLFGLAFGLESAVVSFNRFPLLGVAAARRLTLSLAASYFDDELSLECICDANVSQRGLSAVFRLMGAPPQQPKAFSPAADRHFLGTSIHLGDALFSGFVRIQPKSATVAKVRSKLWDILESKVFPRDAASKLRGDLTWMFSMTAGHLGRLAGPVLTKYQTAENPGLCSDDEFLLRLLVAVVERPVPRQVQVCGPCLLPVVIYTDASFEFSHLRLGWVIFFADGRRPVGGCCDVPPEVVSSWIPRRQQIFAGETLAALVVPLLDGHHFAGADILWFVDNESATSALVRGTSSQDDVHEIAQSAQFLLFSRGCRAWFEWIDTESNPSDGLSRLGVCDPWTLAQNWSVTNHTFPSGLARGELFESLAETRVFLNGG